MNILFLEATEDSPEITLNKDKGIFRITGRSIPENATDFYQSTLDWIKEYQTIPNANTEFIFQLEYFNTASSKVFQDVLQELDKIPGMTITWYYDPADKTTEETLQEYAENLRSKLVLKTL